MVKDPLAPQPKKKAHIRTPQMKQRNNLRNRIKRRRAMRWTFGQETMYDGHTYKHTYITYIHICIPYMCVCVCVRVCEPGEPPRHMFECMVVCACVCMLYAFSPLVPRGRPIT